MKNIEEQIRFCEDIIRGCKFSIEGLASRLADLDRERAAIDAREEMFRKDAARAPERMEKAQQRLKELMQLRSRAGAFGGLTELEKALNKRDRLRKKLEDLEAAIDEAHSN